MSDPLGRQLVKCDCCGKDGDVFDLYECRDEAAYACGVDTWKVDLHIEYACKDNNLKQRDIELVCEDCSIMLVGM